jgi:hypothetical protein
MITAGRAVPRVLGRASHGAVIAPRQARPVRLAAAAAAAPSEVAAVPEAAAAPVTATPGASAGQAAAQQQQQQQQQKRKPRGPVWIDTTTGAIVVSGAATETIVRSLQQVLRAGPRAAP